MSHDSPFDDADEPRLKVGRTLAVILAVAGVGGLLLVCCGVVTVAGIITLGQNASGTFTFVANPSTGTRPAGVPRSADEEQAVRLARQFLERNGTAWGDAVKVQRRPEEGGKVYLVLYATPEREVRVLGDRAVLVNLETNDVKFQPRE